MDFFGQQERARTKTTALVIYFVLAVVFIVVAVYAASLLILHFTQVPADVGANVALPSALTSWRGIEPWDPDYGRESVSVDIDRLEMDILPVGAPFSRLWRNRGICRPVRHPDERGA